MTREQVRLAQQELNRLGIRHQARMQQLRAGR